MSKVAVIDTEKKPLAPCHPAVARRLLKSGKAAVWRTYPFTIILKAAIPAEEIVAPNLMLSWDPGSRVSGLAIVDKDSHEIVYAAELHHRGRSIKSNLETRSGFRRGRRTRNLRHRPARWANRKRRVPVLSENGWRYKPAENDELEDSSKTENKFVRVSNSQLKDKRYKYTRISNRTRKEFTPEMENKEIARLTKEELIRQICMRIKTAKEDELRGKSRGFLRDLLKSKLKNQPPTRYRWKRVRNEHKEQGENGWIAPSLMSRVFNIETWTRRLYRVYPIQALAIEDVKFDMQLLENPDIHGIAYQQGTLWGREIREYLLELTKRKCAYCGKGGQRLEIEHIHPKSAGGSDNVDNLTMACKSCNEKKGNLYGEALKNELGEAFYKKVEAAKRKSKKVLSDAAAVNTIRWKLRETLEATKLTVITGSGGKTAYHRNNAGLPKTHYYDAASVALAPKQPVSLQVLIIQARGYGRRDNIGSGAFRNNKPGFVLPVDKVSHADGFAKFDHVVMKKEKRGCAGVQKYTGFISNFDKTSVGKPRKLRLGYYNPDVKDPREAGNTSYLWRIQKRDGYSYSCTPAPDLNSVSLKYKRRK